MAAKSQTQVAAQRADLDKRLEALEAREAQLKESEAKLAAAQSEFEDRKKQLSDWAEKLNGQSEQLDKKAAELIAKHDAIKNRVASDPLRKDDRRYILKEDTLMRVDRATFRDNQYYDAGSKIMYYEGEKVNPDWMTEVVNPTNKPQEDPDGE